MDERIWDKFLTERDKTVFHFVVAEESFRSPAPTPLRALHRELNRVKERSHECMAR
jgi:hypothetical protein